MTKRTGVTGYAGHVGQEMMKFKDIFPLACDIRRPEDIDKAINHTKPDIILHLAGISDVDVCEKKENQELVLNTNVVGTGNVCEVARDYGCRVVLLSSSQVFDGRWGNYNEKSKPSPKNWYGWSKYGAERLQTTQPHMKIVRTSYLFDYERLFKHIYPLRMGKSFEYPTFIERSFMYLPHFAESLYNYLSRFDEMPNMLHISGYKTSSWYDFVKDIANEYKLDSSLVEPRRYEIESTPRPYKAGLNVRLSKKLGLSQHSYLDGLREMREFGS